MPTINPSQPVVRTLLCQHCGNIILRDSYGELQCVACATYPLWPPRPPTPQEKASVSNLSIGPRLPKAKD